MPSVWPQHPFPLIAPRISGYVDGTPMHLSGSYAGSIEGDTPTRAYTAGGHIYNAGVPLNNQGAGSPISSLGTITTQTPTTPIVSYRTYLANQKEIWAEINSLRAEMKVHVEFIERQQQVIAQQSGIITKLSLGR
jgi:hypothetical protein